MKSLLAIEAINEKKIKIEAIFPPKLKKFTVLKDNYQFLFSGNPM
jgi:hypothetical protein